MSQIGNTGAPTPRRSTRISTKASSIAAESVVTTVTNGGTRLRRQGPLTKVKPRKSNAYGASGRVGTAEELKYSTTGFAQAFQNQRGDAVTRDDEEEEDEDDVDELGADEPFMKGTIRGNAPNHSPSASSSFAASPVLDVPSSIGPGLSFLQSEDNLPSNDDLASDDDPAASIGNTSKSFGPLHEAGMLMQQVPVFSSPQITSTSLFQRTAMRRGFQSRTQMQIPASAMHPPPQLSQAQVTPARKEAIGESIDDMFAQEQARLQRNGPPQPRPHQRSRDRPVHPKDPDAVHDWLGNVEQSLTDEVDTPWRKYISWAFWAVAVLLFTSLVLGALMKRSSEYPETTPRTDMIRAVSARVSDTWHGLAEKIMPSERIEPAVNETQVIVDWLGGDGSDDDHYLWGRIRKNEQDFNRRLGAMHETIQGLQEDLPQLVAVHRHPDGRKEISNEFWKALLSKAQSEHGTAEWEGFLVKNKEILKEIFRVKDEYAPTTQPYAVSRNEFMELMEDHYKSQSTRIDEAIAKAVHEALRTSREEIIATAEAEGKKALYANMRLISFANSNLIANHELTLKKVNYFSLGLGVLIDPRLTSATFSDRAGILAKLARRLTSVPMRNPPTAALTKWEEPGDCWCSAPDALRKGRAQLAVSLSHPIYPSQVTIEHLPMDAAPAGNISNAPRWVELWVETDQPVVYRAGYSDNPCQDGPAGWQCLGRFGYNIHGSNHVQSFYLDATSSVPTRKAMIRVMNNWGADHTCLYRVRLHGEDAQERHDNQVRYDDDS